MEALLKFEYGSLRVETFYNGTERQPNKTYINNVFIYSDETFKPSCLYNIDDNDVIIALLDFLLLEEGATDKEYFETRNCKALDEYSDTMEADEIRMMIYDYQMRDDDDLLEENEMSYEDCCKIEKYIQSC